MLASGRFVKFNEESDSFDPVPREQAALKVCHAIQYQLRREDKAMMECENRKKAKIGLYLPTKTNPMKNVMSMQQESFVSAQATSSGYSEQNAALRVDVAGAASGCERDRKCLREQVAGPAQVRHLPTIDENDFSSLTYAMLLHHVYDCPTQLGELPQPLIGGSPTVPLPLPPADPDAAIFASLLKHQIQQMETEKIKTVAALTARDAAYFSSFLEHKNQQVEAERMEKNATLRLRDAAYFASLLEQQNQQREAVQSGANAALHDIDAHNHDELPPPLVGRPAGHDELPLSSETTAYSKLGDNHANSIDDLIAAALDFVFGKR